MLEKMQEKQSLKICSLLVFDDSEIKWKNNAKCYFLMAYDGLIIYWELFLFQVPYEDGDF